MIIKPDKIGRMVIPNNIRKQFGLLTGKEALSITVENDAIVLKAVYPKCEFCGTTKNLRSLNDKSVCIKCLIKLNESEC